MILRAALALLVCLASPGLAADRAPAAPPPEMAALIGTYGAEPPLVDIRERDGQLRADGAGLADVPLVRNAQRYAATRRGSPALIVFIGREGVVSSMVVDGRPLRRRDTGAEIETRIRAGVRTDIGTIRMGALAMSPPAEPPAERREELVDLARGVPGVRLDIRYATSNNFMGVPLYEQPGAFLQRPAAEALARVAAALRPLGYGLMIHDAYRPWYVTRMFWDATPEESHEFVANPQQGSRHNRGCAVDLTLYRLDSGAVVEMPGRYDEMSPRSYADYSGGTSRQRWERDLLRREMERQGFEVYAQEWWHFDFGGWAKYGIMNVPLSSLIARQRAR
jgi:D-alanyl-D-alanine dipeptidase